MRSASLSREHSFFAMRSCEYSEASGYRQRTQTVVIGNIEFRAGGERIHRLDAHD